MIDTLESLRFVRYLRLRPALLWSLISLVMLLAALFLVRWETSTLYEEQDYLEEFKMVELRLPKAITQPEIDVSDEVSEETVEDLEEEEKPLRFGDETGEFSDLFDALSPPRPIFDSLPQYPSSMRKAGIEGVVVIELGIDENGTILYGKIIRSLGREFDITVIRWAKKLRFYPALDKDKNPIRCRIRLPVRFKLVD